LFLLKKAYQNETKSDNSATDAVKDIS